MTDFEAELQSGDPPSTVGLRGNRGSDVLDRVGQRVLWLSTAMVYAAP
jgi:hypothetical protein